MNFFLLYALLLKATITSFSGLSSLPVVRHDLVVERHLLTDRQLNNAVAIARLTPGPLGLYVVCAGYSAAGLAGALAGFLAMITPAFLVIPLLRYLGRRAENESARRAIRAVTLAAAGLVLSSTIPLGRDALTTPFTMAVAAGTALLLVFNRLDTFWVIVLAAFAGLVRYWVP